MPDDHPALSTTTAVVDELGTDAASTSCPPLATDAAVVSDTGTDATFVPMSKHDLESLQLHLMPQQLLSTAGDMDLRSLQTWRRGSDLANVAGAHALNMRYVSILSSFFNNPSAFRDLLRVTSSVVSGSTALHVLDVSRADSWRPSDIDIYVPRHNFRVVVDYLCVHESYSISNTDPSRYRYDNTTIECVTHLRRGDVDVDVIQSNSPSALLPIPQFWSSHLMNYLTADGFCIAYPQYTLDGRGLLTPHQMVDLQHPTARTMAAMEKYSSRGFDFRTRHLAWLESPTAECDGDIGCSRTVRFFGDPYCLVGSFSPASPTARGIVLPDPNCTVRWVRGGYPCGGRCRFASVYQAAESSRVTTTPFPAPF